MLKFFDETERILEERVLIGPPRGCSILATARDAVSFLKGVAWRLPADLMEAMARYDEFSRMVAMHDAEVKFLRIMCEYDRALKKDEYLPYSAYVKLIDDHKGSFDKVESAEGYLFDEIPDAQARYRSASKDRDSHNKHFVASELARCRAFFDGCEKYKLDEQQRTACVTDEDAGLVVAGAGSGKTSTILAKGRYLVERRGIPASEILLISFTKKSATDVAERLGKFIKGGDSLAQTFHKFGLEIVKAYGNERRGIVDDPEDFLRKEVHSALGGRQGVDCG